MKPEHRTWLTVEEIEKSWLGKPLYLDLPHPSCWIQDEHKVLDERTIAKATLTGWREDSNYDAGPYMRWEMLGGGRELCIYFNSEVPWGDYRGRIFPNFWLAYAEVLRRAKHG